MHPKERAAFKGPLPLFSPPILYSFPFFNLHTNGGREKRMVKGSKKEPIVEEDEEEEDVLPKSA